MHLSTVSHKSAASTWNERWADETRNRKLLCYVVAGNVNHLCNAAATLFRKGMYLWRKANLDWDISALSAWLSPLFYCILFFPTPLWSKKNDSTDPRMSAELVRERERKKKSKLRKSKLAERDKRKKEKRAAEWKWTRTIYHVLRTGAGTLILSCRWIRALVFARSAYQNGKRRTATQHLRETCKVFMHSAQRLLHPFMPDNSYQ